jgi:hypothetical protein
MPPGSRDVPKACQSDPAIPPDEIARMARAHRSRGCREATLMAPSTRERWLQALLVALFVALAAGVWTQLVRDLFWR